MAKQAPVPAAHLFSAGASRGKKMEAKGERRAVVGPACKRHKARPRPSLTWLNGDVLRGVRLPLTESVFASSSV